MNLSLENKVALITGATSGIGEATSRLFVEHDCKVVLAGRNRTKLAELADEFGNHAISAPGDLTDGNYRAELIEGGLSTFGRLDIVVNSAGIIGMGTVEDTILNDFQQMMDTNLTSIFHLMQLATPHLIETRGNIVNISSIAGTRAFPGIVAYCVSKAALDQLTRCAALELAPKGVRVNAINPGVVVTRLHLNGGMNDEKYEQFLEHCKTTHPLGRVGTAEETADLILFLASDSAGWITGETYGIDGGRAQTCAR